MPEQIGLIREVEEGPPLPTVVCKAADVLAESLDRRFKIQHPFRSDIDRLIKDLARAIIAQVREEFANVR